MRDFTKARRAQDIRVTNQIKSPSTYPLVLGLFYLPKEIVCSVALNGREADMMNGTNEKGQTMKINYPIITSGITLDHEQVHGVVFGIAHRSVLIGDEMGVGKTFQGASLALATIQSGFDKFLIVCPPTLRKNWMVELHRIAPELSVALLEGTRPSKQGITALPDSDILLIGDASLSGWANLLTGNISGVVVDECHNFKALHEAKSKRSRRSVALDKVCAGLPDGAIRCFMSGTPLVNTPVDLASIITMLGRQRHFGGHASFMARYMPYSGVSRGRVRRSPANLLELHEKCQTFMIRRTRDEVLDLPNNGRIEISCELSAKFAGEYQIALDDIRQYILDRRGEESARRFDNAEMLVRLGVLRKIAGLGKVEMGIAYAKSLLDLGEKVFITTWHSEVADLYASGLEHYGVAKVVGGMNDKAKHSAVEAFQNGEAMVMIGNIKAVGVGLTLTSARHHISAELPWTSADLVQCEARTLRKGQTRECVSHIMRADLDETSTIDAHLLAIINRKNEILTATLNGEEVPLFDSDQDSTCHRILDALFA